MIFSRTENGWAGKTPAGVLVEFKNMSATDIFKKVREQFINSKIGFRSRDIGPSVVEAYGDVMWMS